MHTLRLFVTIQICLKMFRHRCKFLTGTLLLVRPRTLNSKIGNVKYVGELFQVAKAAKEGVVLNARNIDD